MNDVLVVLLALAGGFVGLLGLLFALRSVRGQSSGDSNVEPEPGARDEKQRQEPDAEAESQLVKEIVECTMEGVVVLDDTLEPTLVNSAARRILGLTDGPPPPRLPHDQLSSLTQRVFDEEKEADDIVDVWFPERMTLKVRVAPLEDRRGVLVLLQDVTQELMAQRIRREFVAHASHELKSPVAGLHALAETVHQAVKEDPLAAARFSERLVAEADRLARLINDLLDLSRLEDGAKPPDKPIDLSAVARREVAEADAAARVKRMQLNARITPEVWVRGDDDQLALMLRNLIENALRYTPEEGAVGVEVRREGVEALLRVSDNGLGIPADAQARVFERFYRVDQARSRERGGTGLGLAIVKHVVELHGGRVELTSRLGEGSTFTVTLPALSSAEPVSQ